MSNNCTLPLVSVVMPSYNHGRFVGAAIESVINQSYDNWELIITDDGSSDNTTEVINSYSDGRIKKFFFTENKGAAIAERNCLRYVNGKYVALLNSDDIWHPDKLLEQVKFLENNTKYAAVFTDVQFVGEDGTAITNAYEFSDIFNVDNKTQGKWLEHFFFKGNCLCHPSVLIKREFYINDYLFKEALRQLPDFYLWIELAKKAPFYVLQDKLVYYRVLRDGKNTSASTPSNGMRCINETYLIYQDFFENISDEVFIEGFKSYFRSTLACANHELLKYEKIFMYFVPHDGMTVLCQLIGIRKLYDCLCNEEDIICLRENYSFGFKEFHKITGSVDAVSLSKDKRLIELTQQIAIKDKRLIELTRQIDLDKAQIDLDKAQINLDKTRIGNLENELQSIYNSKGWKVLSFYYKIRDTIFHKNS